MKKRNLLFVSALTVLMSVAFTGCKDDKDDVKPTAPTEIVTDVTFTDKDVAEGKIGGTLSWNAPKEVANITKYIIYLSSDGKGRDTKLGEVAVGTNSFKVEEGTALNTYILVVASNAQGESEALASFKVVDVKPGIPTSVVTDVAFTDEDLSVSKIAGKLTWKAPTSVSDITKYVVYLSADGNSRDIKLGEVAVGTESFDIAKGTDLKNYIMVVACNEQGEAAEAAKVAVTDAKEMFTGVYVLNSGKNGSNNGSISFLNTKDMKTDVDFFKTVNGRGLGDTANDMIVYGAKMYIAVYGSNVIEITDLRGKSLKQIKSSGEALMPRNLVSYEGKVYVSLYDGRVACLDTTSLEVEKTVKVGRNPEQLVVANNKLYVANSGGLDYNSPLGYDKTVSVIDIASFVETKKIEVVTNPVSLTTDSQGDVYLVSNGNYGDIPNTFQRIDSKTDEVSVITTTNATEMVSTGDKLYIIHSQYDANWNQKISFISYDAINEKVISDNFITDGTVIAKPYKIGADASTGYVYVTNSDYKTNGDVYVFDGNGKKLIQFEVGLNPMKVIYVKE